MFTIVIFSTKTTARMRKQAHAWKCLQEALEEESRRD